MAWWNFSALPTHFFKMTDIPGGVSARYFIVQGGAMVAGTRAAATHVEMVDPDAAFVPRAPKNYYDTLPADKRERDFCLVWFSTRANAEALVSAKISGNKNAGRILDVQRNKWYVVAKEWDYGRQGNLHGVIGELIDGLPPDDLPAPPA